MVVRAQKRNDCITRGANVVMWDTAIEVVDNVVAGDVVEEMRADNSKIAINRCSCPPKESPAFGRVLGNVWVSVVQESDHNNEVVDDTPRNDIDPKQHLETFQVSVEEVEAGDSRQTADIAQEDSRGFAISEHATPDIKVGISPDR